MEGLSRYIAPFGSSWLYTCSSSEPLLECLSHQTPSLAFLWVVVAKAALFRGLLHINAARKVVVMHLMWWQQLSHRYSWISFFLVCLWSTSPPLELLGGSFWLLQCIPSNTFSNFLWVVVAKVALFRGFHHINATKKVAAMHLMR